MQHRFLTMQLFSMVKRGEGLSHFDQKTRRLRAGRVEYLSGHVEAPESFTPLSDPASFALGDCYSVETKLTLNWLLRTMAQKDL